MSGYEAFNRKRREPEEGIKPTQEHLPLYPASTGTRSRDSYSVQTAVPYRTEDQDRTTRGKDCLQDAFCFPEDPRVVRKPDDDEAPIIPEKYINVSPAHV